MNSSGESATRRLLDAGTRTHKEPGQLVAQIHDSPPTARRRARMLRHQTGFD